MNTAIKTPERFTSIKANYSKICPICDGFEKIAIDNTLLKTCGFCKGSGFVHNQGSRPRIIRSKG